MKLTFSKAVKKISTTLFVLTILFNSISCKMQEDPDPEILIKDLSKLEGIVKALYNIPEIVECHFTTGPYTMLVKLFARDNEQLMNLLNGQLQDIPGVVTTETLISLEQSIKREIPVSIIDEKVK